MSRVDYQLRPTKHVERKIFVEVLTHLRGLDCDISNYQYVGMGAPYFIDFLLFHKHLYIKKMTSFENNTGLIGRVKFNQPFRNIEVIEGDVTTALAPLIKEKQRYFIWLDYECALDVDILGAIGILSGLVAEGSILVVTVNAHLPGVSDADHRKEEIQRYLDLFSSRIPGIQENDITPNALKNLYAKAMRAEVEQGVLARPNEEFVQLFNYSYSDGASMLSFGGIFKTKDEAFKKRVGEIKYVNQSDEPTEISVPALTHKERIWLDAYGDSAKKTEKTGLMPDDIKKYFEFASHYPTYYEIAI